MRRILVALAIAPLAALAISATASGGGQVTVKNGAYAGGGNKLFVFFDVSGRSIPDVRLHSVRLEDCNGFSGPSVSGPAPVDNQGRFKLREQVNPENNIKVTGKFVRSRKVKGEVRWITEDDCPSDTYNFDFKADLNRPLP